MKRMKLFAKAPICFNIAEAASWLYYVLALAGLGTIYGVVLFLFNSFANKWALDAPNFSIQLATRVNVFDS